MTQRIPASRGRLYRQLKRLGKPSSEPIATANLSFAKIVVDAGACSACGMCTRFCPTGALDLATRAGRFMLSFQSAACTDCGLCAVACPEDAVSFGVALLPEALVMNKPQPLVAGDLAACADCGQPTVAQNAAPPRCSVCRRRADPAMLFAGGSNCYAIFELLKASAALHRHLCPRQVPGVRMRLLAGTVLCQSCAGQGYCYHVAKFMSVPSAATSVLEKDGMLRRGPFRGRQEYL